MLFRWRLRLIEPDLDPGLRGLIDREVPRDDASAVAGAGRSLLELDVVHDHQALLIQLRRDAVSLTTPPRPWAGEVKARKPFLDPEVSCNISPTDIDLLASEMNRRLNRGRAFLHL